MRARFPAPDACRIDRRGLAKQRHAARLAHHKAKAESIVGSIADEARDDDDLELALDAALTALAAKRTSIRGEASTVALLGSLARQEGAGIIGPKRTIRDFRALVAAEAGRGE